MAGMTASTFVEPRFGQPTRQLDSYHNMHRIAARCPRLVNLNTLIL